MKAKLEFGKRGRVTPENAARPPSLMERLMKIGRRLWPGQRLNKGGPGVKLSKSRSLPQRRR
jgi:hypothetical protein